MVCFAQVLSSKAKGMALVIQSGSQWALFPLVQSDTAGDCGRHGHKTDPPVKVQGRLRMHSCNSYIPGVLKTHCFMGVGGSVWNQSDNRKWTNFLFIREKRCALCIDINPPPGFPVPTSAVAFLSFLLSNFSLRKIHFPSHSISQKSGSESEEEIALVVSYIYCFPSLSSLLSLMKND